MDQISRRCAIRYPSAVYMNTLALGRLQAENQRWRLAEIPSMKNKAGREKEDCRICRSVGDNQHQV